MTERRKAKPQSETDTVHVCIAMPRDLHQRLKEQARKQDMTASAVTRMAVRNALAASGAPEAESEH